MRSGSCSWCRRPSVSAAPAAPWSWPAFTHLNPEGSRFSDGSYGVYYAANTLETAVDEVRYHRARFLARTREPAIEVDLRAIVAGVQGDLHDLRTLGLAHPVLDPAHYGVSQALAGRLRAAGSPGVQFPSVRHSGGVCIGAFRPTVVRHAKAGTCVTLHWNGERITHWYEKTQFARSDRRLGAWAAESVARAGCRPGFQL